MLLRGGAFSACNAVVLESHGSRRFSGKSDAVWFGRAHFQQVMSVATDEPKSKQQELSLANRLRLGGLCEDGLAFKEKYIVRSYEVGSNKTVTVQTIANFLQDASCNHYLSLGFLTDGFSTTPTMRKLNVIWVTTRMHIEMYRYPGWGDVVEIETWCLLDGFGGRREWIINDYATGEVIGRATSKWVVVNQDTRRLQKFNDELLKEFVVYCAKSRRLAFPEENSASMKKIAKLDDPAQYSKVGLVPKLEDLDMNHHVNNVTYIEWALESIPLEIIDSHELQAIMLDFRRECQRDDVIDSLTTPQIAKDENGYPHFLHLLRLSKNGLEVGRGRTVWRKKSG